MAASAGARHFRSVTGGGSGLGSYLTNIGTESASVPTYWFNEVASTMDTARDLLRLNELECASRGFFAVLAKSQTLGRGTRGRRWIPGGGNLYLTLVVDKSLLPSGVPLTLVPLRIGSLLHPIIRSRVGSAATVQLKWPNDVLVDDKKVSGMLIEIENDKLLIGIGMNVMSAPPVPDSNDDADAGRSSTCIYNHQTAEQQQCSSGGGGGGEDDCSSEQQDGIIQGLADEVGESVQKWLASQDTGAAVIDDFSSNMLKSALKLRGNAGERGPGAQVTPLRINPDGSLQVRYNADGTEGTLMADYLW